MKVEFIESYIKLDDGSDYIWSDNHGELIRCSNCKHWWCLDQLDWDGQCDHLQRVTTSDWYCADGKRRE